jgi:hypothetical protein
MLDDLLDAEREVQQRRGLIELTFGVGQGLSSFWMLLPSSVMRSPGNLSGAATPRGRGFESDSGGVASEYRREAVTGTGA